MSGQFNSRQVKLGQVKIFPGDICHLSRITAEILASSSLKYGVQLSV